MKIFASQSAKIAKQIIELQKENLVSLVDDNEKQSQGFVTAQHTFEILSEMMWASPSIVAYDADILAGYVLSMTQEFRDALPVLVPFFDLIENLSFQNQLIKDYKYMIVGQTCVAKNYRGSGIFRKMYEAYAVLHQNNYDIAITEIATENTRSMAAHQKLGFEEISRYTAENGVEWSVVAWNFSTKNNPI